MRDIELVSFVDVFTPQEVADIRLLGEAAKPRRAEADDAASDYRDSSVAWLEPEGWLRDKLREVIDTINDQFFEFDISPAFAEPFQYTVYGVGEYFRWHMDKGPKTPAPRKLSLIVQLSAPDEYDGGELQIRTGADITQMPREQGRVIAFPSWVLHRVLPVTRGIRRSLVVWAHGEPFT